MTNEQKYTTAEERVKAFRKWRKKNCGDLAIGCKGCEIQSHCDGNDVKFAYWLALPCEEEKPMPCPFCETTAAVCYDKGCDYQVVCERECGYSSMEFDNKSEAIAAHNRVCRAVEAAKKGESNA